MKTQRITTEIAQAADAIRAGQLVAVPTETVYGLAGNGLDPKAVAQIYEVKGRPSVKPLSLMVHDASAMARYCDPVPQAAHTLAEAFWPGPLTIVLRAKACVPEIVRAGGQTVGLRCPDHPATLALIEAVENGTDYSGPGFTSVYFHHQRNILPFMETFGLEKLHLFGQEGFLAPNKFDLAGRDRAERERWLELAKRTIELPELLNWSEHAMYIGRKLP